MYYLHLNLLFKINERYQNINEQCHVLEDYT